MKIHLIVLLFSLAIPVAFVRAEIVEDSADSATVLHDPFQKPAFMLPSVKPIKSDQTDKSPWIPHLIMTLRAGGNSMANVGGQLIRLGEEINGYKLIEVYERSVVFVNQGKITRLTLDEEDQENGIYESF
jgi:hypothetical protein